MVTETDTSRRHADAESVPWPQQVRSFAVRSTRTIVRDRSALFWAFVWPAFWYIMTSLTFISPPADASNPAQQLGYAKAGTAISIGVFGAMSVSLIVLGTRLSTDRTERRYRMLRTLPVSPSADLTGRFLATFAFSVASFCTIVAISLVDGALYPAAGPLAVPIVLGCLLGVCLTSAGVSVVLAEVVRRREYVVAVGTVGLLVWFFFSGFNGGVPSLLPEQAQQLLNIVPNTVGTRTITSHLIGTPLPSDPQPPGAAVALATVLGWGGLGYGLGVAVATRSIYDRGGR
ncbi:ABC transporter permease [Haloarchaeobius sp. TZWSO28]|uniref:ABC transporter permease n=1 Tax=Haloarchaeobius sp. TZWSO28 TaxID=3446119 RepID=UPI003EBA23A8